MPPCVPNVIPAPPGLGGGLSVPAFAPPAPPTPGACCQLVVLPPGPGIIPLPVPPAALIAAAAVLNAKLTIMMNWIDSLPLKCPRS